MHRFTLLLYIITKIYATFLFANILLKKKNIFSIFVNFIRFFYPYFSLFYEFVKDLSILMTSHALIL